MGAHKVMLDLLQVSYDQVGSGLVTFSVLFPFL